MHSLLDGCCAEGAELALHHLCIGMQLLLLLLALLQLLSQLPPHHNKLFVLCESRLLLLLMLSLQRIEICESLVLLFLMLVLSLLPLLGFLPRPLLGPLLRTLSLSECGHVGGQGRWRLGQ